MKQRNWSIPTLITAFALGMAFTPQTVNAESELFPVEICRDSFPDENFKEFVATHFDTDSDGILSPDEAEVVDTIIIDHHDINGLHGIEYFPNLKYLDCSFNNIGGLNVNANPELEQLYCDHNNLSELNVSFNPKLKVLHAQQNHITEIDTSYNPELTNDNLFYVPENVFLESDYYDYGNVPGFKEHILGNDYKETSLTLYPEDNTLVLHNRLGVGRIHVFLTDQNGEDYEDIYTFEMYKDGWFQNELPDKFVWLYYNENELALGWHYIDGYWYYFDDETGEMLTGWVYDNDTWYYMLPSGNMATGWAAVDGSWYFLTESGAMITGWYNINGVWYYFDNSGVMQTGWLHEGGNWYYLDNSGAMVTDWYMVNGTWYYFYESGPMASNMWINGYYVDETGACV